MQPITLAVQNPRSPYVGKDPATVTYTDGALVCGDLRMTFAALLTTVDVPAVAPGAGCRRARGVR